MSVIETETKSEFIAEKPLPTGTERILFIDDEKVFVRMGRKMLEGSGYEVATETGSLAAPELFKADPEQFDLIITDMTKPHMTGDKLAVEIMKIRPEIPMTLCAGFNSSISAEANPLFRIAQLKLPASGRSQSHQAYGNDEGGVAALLTGPQFDAPALSLVAHPPGAGNVLLNFQIPLK